MSAAKNAAAQSKGFSLPVLVVIVVELVLCFLIWKFVLGAGSNFEGGNNEGHPLPGNYLGIVYKGGIMVPVLMTLMLVVLTFCFERLFTIAKAQGSGSVDNFVRNVQAKLAGGDVDGAIKACDSQKGSVANVVRAGLVKYKEMTVDTELDKEQKMAAIQKEVEEATSLELPMLEKNLVILATISSIATLMGLLGTVLGMIKAFAALATAGSPDAVALANGISEALINTALGISTSAIAIIMYNVFTTRIDQLTYAIDEAGFSLAQTFAAKHK
ncbi:MAG TPA: MotA/TolQ/ExbB proton channel family protein [Chitinophagales bacterium]|nr:MotA/TolQ/ExbB proton channel family protein [Chitinophagales bacterium]